MSNPEIDPRERDLEAKRQRILRAALQVCTRAGAASARMEEIAQVAQVSKGTLYRFFESREELLLAAALQSYEQAIQANDSRVPASADPRERLKRLFDGLTAALAQIGATARVHYQAWSIAAVSAEFEERLMGVLRRVNSERHAHIESVVRAGQEAGVFRGDLPAGMVADAIAALLAGFIYRVNFDPQGATPEALRACLDRLVLASLEVPSAQRPPATSGRL